MMTPAVAFHRLVAALGLGCLLGLWYGFLRPVRPRWLGDLFFVMALCYGWLVLSFGVCRGDIRLGYTAAIGLGAVAFDRGPGRLFRGPFRWFWGLVGRCFRLFINFFQKIGYTLSYPHQLPSVSKLTMGANGAMR